MSARNRKLDIWYICQFYQESFDEIKSEGKPK